MHCLGMSQTAIAINRRRVISTNAVETRTRIIRIEAAVHILFSEEHLTDPSKRSVQQTKAQWETRRPVPLHVLQER